MVQCMCVFVKTWQIRSTDAPVASSARCTLFVVAGHLLPPYCAAQVGGDALREDAVLKQRPNTSEGWPRGKA